MHLLRIRIAAICFSALCCGWTDVTALSLESKKPINSVNLQRMAILQRMIKVSPKHSPTFGALGLMESNLGHYPLAITYYDRAIALHEQELKDPANNCVAREIVTQSLAKSLCQRARCFMAEERFDRSLEDINRSLEYSPREGETYQLRADVYKAMGKNVLARESERKSAELVKWTVTDDKYREAMKSAMARLGENSLENAVRSCDQAISLMPERSDAHLWRARNLRMLGKLSLASDEYARILKLHPTDKIIQDERRSMKSLAKQIGYVANSSETISTDEEQAATAIGTETALTNLSQIEKFQKRYPYNNFGLWAHAEKTANDRNFAATRADYDKLLLFEPWEPEIFVRRADCEHAMHLWDQAISDYTKWLSKAPLCIDWQWGQGSWHRFKLTFLAKANCLKHLGQYSKAIDDCKLAITLEPDDGAIYQKRAEIYFAQQDFAHAVADYKSAIELDREPTASNLTGRAMAYEKLGERDLALKDRQLAKKLADSKALVF